MPQLSVRVERFPIAGTFTIARGSKTEAVVVVARLEADGRAGEGECVPYARYGETVEGTVKTLEQLAKAVSDDLDRTTLQAALPAGAARNALDCAFWDLEAKTHGTPVASRLGLVPPAPLVTAYTLSLDSPEAMARAATASGRPLLKLKLGAEGDEERLAAIRSAVPQARLIVDANEGWSPDTLEARMAACARFGVELIEQPLPADNDAMLAQVKRPVTICADESVHDRHGLAALRDRYDAINIKLDKAGGLTEALALAQEGEALGFKLMVGCMLATSLAMAPALLLAQKAQVVDLDGPLLLARDRQPGIRYDGALAYPPTPDLWG